MFYVSFKTIFSRFSLYLDKPDRAGEQHRCHRKTGKDYQETSRAEANQTVQDDY